MRVFIVFLIAGIFISLTSCRTLTKPELGLSSKKRTEITLFVKVTSGQIIPAGSRIVTVLAKKTGAKTVIIGGNSRAVVKAGAEKRLSIPLNAGIIRKCLGSNGCLLITQVVKNGVTLFKADKPAPFQTDKAEFVIQVYP